MTKNVLSFFRLRSFDESTEEGRSKERYRRIARSAMATAVMRALSLVTLLISVPLTTRYLGSERFGLWMTITSLIAMLTFADIGMGNGLVSALSGASGRDDKHAATSFVSSTFFVLLAIAALLGCVFALAYPHIDWPGVFNVQSAQAASESGPALAVFVALFLASMPLGVAQKVHLGYQEGFTASLWVGAGSLLGLGGLLTAVLLGAGLPWLVLGVAGGPVVASAMNTLVLFGKIKPHLLPRLANVNRRSVHFVTGIGFLFFALGLAAALGYQSDNIVVARTLGAEKVTQLAVPMRLFMIAPTLLSFILAPLWPAYGESIARGDTAWVRRTLKRSFVAGIVVNVPAALLLLIFGRRIIAIWAGPEVFVPLILMIGLAMWAILTGVLGPLAMFFNGANVIKFQVFWSLVMGISNLAMSIVLARRIGVAGVVFGTVMSQLVFLVLPYLRKIRQVLASISEDPRPLPTVQGVGDSLLPE